MRYAQASLIVLVFAVALGSTNARCSAPEAGSRPVQAVGRVVQAPAWNKPLRGWATVDALVEEQKLEAASGMAEKLLADARKARNVAEEVRALVRLTQMRMGLHGYETAVRNLKDAPWPNDPLAQAALNLYYAQALVTYGNGYSWEIRQREEVASTGPVDLKAWTARQIRAEAQAAFGAAWKQREALGGLARDALPEFVSANDYPDGIRPTLRDALTYLFASFLDDSGDWTPAQSGDVYLLDLNGLLGPARPATDADLAADRHPLESLAAVLGDLEAWHGARRAVGARLEARLQRIRHLHEHFTQDDDRTRIREHLASTLDTTRADPWWSVGMALLAELTRSRNVWDADAVARTIAEQGWKAFPDDVGGRRCLYIVRAIEAPAFTMNAMASDAPDRRSIGVTSRNLGQLHFRAWRIADPWDLIERSDDYHLMPRGNELEARLRRSPDHAWSVELPMLPDYRDHQTWVMPPMRTPGLWIVAASADPGFGEEANVRTAVPMVVGDLVLTRSVEDADVHVRVLSGATGRPVAGAEIRMYRKDWSKGHKVAARATSGDDGRAILKAGGTGNQWFVAAQKDDQFALDADAFWLGRPSRPQARDAALIYTDRSIYRPGQTLKFKVLAYGTQTPGERFRTLPGRNLTVTLRDANGQQVEAVEVKTNTHGTASGQFLLPAGRMLGPWRLVASIPGTAVVAVEEYKRPTFEAKFLDPEAPLRLNRPAVIKGEARYYFGLPVPAGTVAWKVQRVTIFPWWWGWWGMPAPAPRIVATGRAPLASDGTFQIAFTPEADERTAQGGTTWRYEVHADVTDEGGETRPARRTFRLGFATVEARITLDQGFVPAGTKVAPAVVRSDLDGRPAPGPGSWRLVALEAPATAVLPADRPIPRTPDQDPAAPRTPGDAQAPRWEARYDVSTWLSDWKDGREAASGELRHDAEGRATIALPSLAPGAWRVHYRTKDAFGANAEATLDFLVAGDASLPLPLVLRAETGSVPVGGTARFLVHSGLGNQPLLFEVFRAGKRISRQEWAAGDAPRVVALPVGEKDRGGFTVRATTLRDHQALRQEASVFVPWDDRQLTVRMTTFRDLMRPGAREKWTLQVTGTGRRPAPVAAAEVLAYLYDRSLDVFAPHLPPNPLSLYATRTGAPPVATSLGLAQTLGLRSEGFPSLPDYPQLMPDQLVLLDGYGIGGPGRRFGTGRGGGGLGGGGILMMKSAAMPAPMSADEAPAMARAGLVSREVASPEAAEDKREEEGDDADAPLAPEAPAAEIRTQFAETAFWEPHLLTGADGSASFEFTVPDSVTSWNLWVHAVTRDMKAGSLTRQARSVKDLMVRPYLPRFLREGDRAELRVVVNNASDRDLKGTLSLDLRDPDTDTSLATQFGLSGKARPFTAPASGSTTLTFPITVPARVGTVAFLATATAGDLSDGELRPIPVLPGRMHLAQSRFVTLKDRDRRTMTFDDLARNDDPTRIDDQMVVTVDGQLFYQVLSALPYLVNYPYECVEQTMNRFLSTGILTSLYGDYPAVASMAKQMAARTTRFETWDALDPNRRMALEETPWVRQARGGDVPDADLLNVLDPRIALAQREASLAKLRKAQTSSGGFPWFPGGPPSPYMTLYIVHGFSKALEFGVQIPRDVLVRAWAYLHRHYLDEIVRTMRRDDCCWEFVTLINYVLSNYPDDSWTDGVFTQAERDEMLAHSFRHWKAHSPYLKGLLALALHRAKRAKDAKLVWDSVMDSAKTAQDQGTFWAPEDRGWLWYNDTIETHAFALRTLMEMDPSNPKMDGLVLWLFLNKKLNHWKSTRATAEVVYSLAHYLKRSGGIANREVIRVAAGDVSQEFVFEPDRYTGKRNQVVIPGDRIDPQTTSTVTVAKDTQGYAFASATWHFSTERMPDEARGDFLAVSRTYFRRSTKGDKVVLEPLAEGAKVAVGDEVEVQLSIRAKHSMEYVHLRDPRGAGFEPADHRSRHKWDLGIAWYEEIRDSGTNFFFEWLPQGEYTFKYRVRAAVAGTWKAAPATLQPMYAPEFSAYSAGNVLDITGE